jgi:amino acid permease
MSSAAEGTYWSSVLLVLQAVLGAGILTIPYVFKSAGRTGGTLLLLTFGFAEILSLYVIILSTEASRATNYSGVVKYYLGEVCHKVFSGMASLYCFVSIVSSLVIIKNIDETFEHLKVDDSNNSKHVELSILFALCITFPFAVKRRLTEIWMVGAFSLMIWIVLVIIVFKESYSDIDREGTSVSSSGFAWGENVWDSITAIPMLVLAYHSHIPMPNIYSDVRPDLRTPQFMLSAVVVAYIIIFLLYFAVGLVAFGMFGNATKSNLMSCAFSPSSSVIKFGRIAIAIVQTMNIPMNCIVSRGALFSLLGEKEKLREIQQQQKEPTNGNGNQKANAVMEMVANGDDNNKNNNNNDGEDDDKKNIQQYTKDISARALHISTIMIYCSAGLIAHLVSNLKTISAIIGLTTDAAIIFILPGFFLLSGIKKVPDRYGWGLVAIGVFVFFSCAVSLTSE